MLLLLMLMTFMIGIFITDVNITHHVFFEFTIPYVFKQYVMWIIIAQLLENAIITMLIGKVSESCQL